MSSGHLIVLICAGVTGAVLAQFIEGVWAKRKLKFKKLYYSVDISLMKEGEIPEEFMRRAINSGLGETEIK